MKEKNSYISAVGRRKEAIARIRLIAGKGVLTVNGKPIDQYFSGIVFEKIYTKPFLATDSLNKYYGSIIVRGGGSSSQLGAVVHGLSRALLKANAEKFRAGLKKEHLLTRDPRVKERRKYGHAQKARAMKQSPKR